MTLRVVTNNISEQFSPNMCDSMNILNITCVYILLPRLYTTQVRPAIVSSPSTHPLFFSHLHHMHFSKHTSSLVPCPIFLYSQLLYYSLIPLFIRSHFLFQYFFSLPFQCRYLKITSLFSPVFPAEILNFLKHFHSSFYSIQARRKSSSLDIMQLLFLLPLSHLIPKTRIHTLQLASQRFHNTSYLLLTRFHLFMTQYSWCLAFSIPSSHV